MLGGLLGSLLLPRLAEAAGYPAAFLATAGGLVLMAVASLWLRPARPVAADVAPPVQVPNAVG
jgi:hypothetical protein